jgi:hypothetical protein
MLHLMYCMDVQYSSVGFVDSHRPFLQKSVRSLESPPLYYQHLLVWTRLLNTTNDDQAARRRALQNIVALRLRVIEPDAATEEIIRKAIIGEISVAEVLSLLRPNLDVLRAYYAKRARMEIQVVPNDGTGWKVLVPRGSPDKMPFVFVVASQLEAIRLAKTFLVYGLSIRVFSD